MNENGNNLNTVRYVYDDIKKVVSSCVIKYDNLARANETAESKRDFDYYYIASQKIDTFDSYPSFPIHVLENAGILDISKLNSYVDDKYLIPKELRTKVLEENRKFIINTYEEKNNYYRTLIGLPDIGDDDFIYLDEELCDRYDLDPTMPIHMYEDHDINSISYHMDDIISKYPHKEYLKFLGKNKVNLIRARTARNFEIIRCDMSSHVVFLKIFFQTYDLAREYFTSVIYVKEKYNQDNLYDNFIAMNIMIMTIQRVMVDTFKLGVDRDFYDLESIKSFFNSYGIPFFETLPLDYQRTIMKRLNILLRSKSTDRCLYDIANILFFDRVTILEYYLMKEKKYDENDIPLDIKKPIEDIDGNIRYIEDIDKMYDLYFQAVDIKEQNVSLALENKSNSYDYYEVTYEDPHWWDDEDLRLKLTESEFNYIDTKYLGINIMYNLTQLMFETVYFINMLVDKKNQIHRPKLNFFLTIKLPRITVDPVSIFDAVILLCALTCKKNHFKGNIIKSGAQILTVMGFDFEENFKLIRENIKNDKQQKVYDHETLKYLENLNVHSKDDIRKLYEDIVGLADFCIQKMNNTDDIKVYHAYKYLYDSLMVKEYTNKVLSKENGEIADTYLDYLDDQNPFLADFVNNCTIEQTGIYIDHILGTLNELIPDLEYLSAINGTDNILVQVLVKLIDFFKSYTVDLRNINILYVMDSRRYNMIKMITDYTISAKIENDEYIRFYLDNIETLGVENFFKDYVKPIEMIYVYNKISCSDKIDYDDDFTISIRLLYGDMIKAIYADYISLSTNVDSSFKLILEHMQQFMSNIIINENIKLDSDWFLYGNINYDESMLTKYSDDVYDIFNNIIDKYKIDITDLVTYDFNIACEEIIKAIEDYCIHVNIEHNDLMYLYIDSFKFVINNMEYRDNSITFEDMYNIFNDIICMGILLKKEQHDIVSSMRKDENIVNKYSDYMITNNEIIEDGYINMKEKIKIYYD